MRRVKVILQQDYPRLGFIGDQIDVRGGYARNYLIPRGIAFEASESHQRLLKHRLSVVNAKKVRLRGEAEKISREIEGIIPEFTLRFGEGGKSFGSISNRDIAKWLDEKGYKLDRSQILIPEPIKKSGEHQIKVKLHSEVMAQLKVRVSAEAPAASAAPAEGSAAARGTARKGRGRARKSDQEASTSAQESAESAERPAE